MLPVSEHLRNLGRIIISAGNYTLHEVKIYFSAPSPKHPSIETLTVEPTKQLEANFQWADYAILFTDKKMNWFIYKISLNPWGTAQAGTQEVIASDSMWKLYRDQKVEIEPKEVERSFTILRKPELHPEAKVSYINSHKSDKGRAYSSTEFKQFFDNNFYVVISKDKKLVNPFGKAVGIQPTK
jgi:hypothetical protein